MKISKIGEFGLIGKIKAMIKTNAAVIKGIGDDCAVIKFTLLLRAGAGFTRDKYMLLTCDMLIEGVDFLKSDSPYLVGAKSMAASISDIAANGGWPSYALVSLGLPPSIDVKYVRGLYRGMECWAKKYKINIVGGDISRSEKIVINVSLIGFVEKEYLTLRSGARVGDIIFVTGKLGAAAIDKRRLHVVPRLKEARYLVQNYKVNAMIDLSDGLLQDLFHITESSQVGALIYQELVPLYKKKEEFFAVLSRGEDFELLFTLPAKEAKRLVASGKRAYSFIGEVTDRKYGVRLLDMKYRERPLKPIGFRHF